MDSEILINEVRKRKSLWETRCRKYSKRELTRKLWDEVAVILKCDREATKKRWKNLRDTYRVELKKITDKPKSKKGTVKLSKWAYFNSLEFLRDEFESNPLEENLVVEETSTFFSDLNPEETSTYFNNITPEETPTFLNEFKQEKNSAHTSPSHEKEDSIVYTDSNSQYLYSPSQSSSCFGTVTKKIKYDDDAKEDAFLQLEKEKLKLFRAETDKSTDSDYHFLISCLPHLKSLSQIDNLKFRMETSKLLMELKQNETNTTSN